MNINNKFKNKVEKSVKKLLIKKSSTLYILQAIFIILV